MKILLFNPMLPELNQKIVEELSARDDCRVIEIPDRKTFKKALQDSLSGHTVVVCSLCDEHDLCFIESLKKSIIDIKLLINMVQLSESFMNRISKLSPRVLTTMESGASMCVLPEAVLKIVKNQTIR